MLVKNRKCYIAKRVVTSKMVDLPVNSTVTSLGIAVILKHASSCCLTSGLVGAMKMIFPNGYHR